MKRAGFVISVCASLVLISPRPTWADFPAGSPEDVLIKAMEALNRGRVMEFVKSIHPDELKEFQTQFVEVLDLAVKKGEEGQLLHGLPTIKTARQAKSLDATQLTAAIARSMIDNPDMKQVRYSTKLEGLGHIDKGPDSTYVVYRVITKLGKDPTVREDAAQLRKNGSEWKVKLPANFKRALDGIRRNLVRDLTLPDRQKTRVEVIGHILDVNETAFIVYRAIMPVGESSTSRLAVLRMEKNGIGWSELRAGKTAEIQAMIESFLGARKPPSFPKNGEPQGKTS